MRELTRTTNPVLLSWLTAELKARGIDTLVLDTHTSIIEGSIGILPRRVMVVDEDFDEARAVLTEGPPPIEDDA